MPVSAELAEHGTGFCVAAAGMVMSGAVGGAVLVPMAVLTAMGLQRIASCDGATVRRARDSVIAALRDSHEITEEDAHIARDLLKDSRRLITFDPPAMVEAARSGNLGAALMQAVLDGETLRDQSEGVLRALSLTLRTTFEAFRNVQSYQGAFTQEIVLTLLREHGVVVQRLEQIAEKQTTEVERAEARHQEQMAFLRQSDEFRRMREGGITEKAIIELARRIDERISDPAAAWAQFQSLVDVALRVQTEGRTGSNQGDFVSAVLAEVADLSRDGRHDEASESIDEALAREEAESAARKLRLLEAGIE